jgi:hypothetical protein
MKPLTRSDVMAAISRRHSSANRSIFVLDGIFDATAIASIFRWFRQRPFHHHDADREDTMAFRHWITLFSPATDQVMSIPVLGRMAEAAQICFRIPQLSPTRAHGYCVPYGDVHFSHKDFGENAGVSVVYFADPEWREDWGGEMLFHGPSGEPEIAVRPRPGRMVVFRGDIPHRGGTPTRIAPPRHTLVVRLDTGGSRGHRTEHKPVAEG